MKNYVIGIDVGGTNIKLGLVNPSGKIISRTNLETKAFIRNKKRLIDALIQAVKDLISQNGLKKKDIAGIGIGFPGLVDPVQGNVIFLPNIPGWKNVPFRQIFKNRLGIPTFIDNDVKLITLGEWRYGAGRGVKNLICLTLGTGVGSGLVLNNQLYRGASYVAGELGHMPLNEKGLSCNCGGYGCLETYIGKNYLYKSAGKMMNRKGVTTPEMFKLANQGNPKALKFWKEISTHLGNGLVGIVNLLNPELIIIGGGVSNNYKYIFPTVRGVIQKKAMIAQRSIVRIVRGQLGDDAGIIGAKALVSGGF